MKEDFSAKSKETEDSEAVNPEALEAIEGDSGSNVPVVRADMKLGETVGAVSEQDIIVPRLMLTQGIGPLSESFPVGSWVLNKEYMIAEEGEPLRITVLSLRKYFRERLPYDPNGPLPETYGSMEEVIAAGKTIEWTGPSNSRLPPTAEPQADILVLVKRPEELECPAFSRTFEGDDDEAGDYAVALWIASRTAYTKGAKPILTKRALEFREPPFLLAAEWVLTSHKHQSGGYTIRAPQLTVVRRHSDEFVEFAATTLQ